MKSKFLKILISTVCMVCLALGVAALSACGGGDKKITYEGGSVTAVVGEASSATVATATGADGITYALKDGSSLT